MASPVSVMGQVQVGQKGGDAVAEGRDSEFAGVAGRKGKDVVHQQVDGCNLAAEDSCPSGMGESLGSFRGSNWSQKLLPSCGINVLSRQVGIYVRGNAV